MLVYVELFVVVATQVAHAQLEGTNSKCCVFPLRLIVI